MIKEEGYQALSDLIYKGFLLEGVSLAGNFFVFKTLNEREHKLVKLYSGFEDDKSYVNRFNLNYLVFSLFLFMGKIFFLKGKKSITKY